MNCPRCQHENETGAKFCEECAAPLARACAKCGRQLSPTAKFCPECAHPTGLSAAPSPAQRFDSSESYTPKHLAEKILTSKSALEGERKQVTVLFADLKGSMELLADRDPEEARKILDPVLERMMEAVHRYEGTVNQVMGDGIMALFGAPVAHEDHAVRACYAALRMQESVKRYADGVFRSFGVPIQIRVGLNSGEVVVRAIGSDLHMDYTAVGQSTHLAARMEQMAQPGTILLTAETLALAEGLVQVNSRGPVPVKGLAEPIEIFDLAAASPVRSRLQAAASRGLTRFVGRNAEIEQLRQALGRAGAGHGQVVAVVGEPGVGKSRLVWEFTHSHRSQGWLILETASVSYGKATTYFPVIELLRSYFAIEPRDDGRKMREKVTGKLLSLDRALEPTLPVFLSLLDVAVEDSEWTKLDPAQRRRQTLEALKRLLVRESQVQPVLLVVEDLHWIDGETQAWFDLLVESLPTARLLVLTNYRPEYSHGWGSKTYYQQVRLDTLPAASAGELLEALLGTGPGLADLERLLIERTQGNSFFLEESVRTLVEARALIGERGTYRLAGPIRTLQLPATAQAILAARIDRLAPEDKRLLQAAAVVGKDVSYPLLHAIATTHCNLGEFDEALTFGTRALDIARARGDARLRCIAANSLEQVHYCRGEYEQVIEVATDTLRALGDRAHESFILGRPASVSERAYIMVSLAQLGRFRAAAQCEAEMVQFAEATHAYGIGWAHLFACDFRLVEGDWAKAHSRIEHAIAAIMGNVGQFGQILALAISSAAWVRAQHGAAGEALHRLQEGEQLLERRAARGVVAWQGGAYHALGRAALLLGRLDEAQRLGDRAVESSPAQATFLAPALHLLGDIATRPERFDAERGEAHYRQALALAEPRGMRPLVAHCHLGLGKLYRRTGKPEQAQEHLTTATAMYREMRMTYWLRQAETESNQAN